ncbi:hypothetical protein JCM10213_000873 [Rhodosporidiobolus nylandii]
MADACRLGRLRLVRLPPAFIVVPRGAKGAATVPVELAVGVTDDYGVDLDMFESLELQIELLDAATLTPPAGVSLRLENTSSLSSASPPSAATFTFTPSRGPFHALKLSLTFPSSTRALPGVLSFRLSVAHSPSSSTSLPPTESAATRRIRRLVGEEDQEVLETWDEKRYVFMGLRSGNVELRVEGKEAKVAGQKVQTALRTLHLAAASSSSPAVSSSPVSSASTMTIVERPGLNNSTGQRLWDCAIGLSCFFSLFPSALDAATPLSSFSSAADDSAPPAKRARVSQGEPGRRVKVVELGAGCALASMAAAKRLLPGAEVLATDVQATVESTLRENLAANGLLEDGEERGVHAGVIDWGVLSPERVATLSRSGGQPVPLTLIGSDILYNPSSHPLLLSSLLSFLRPADSSPVEQPRRALIAYKHRTEGDDAFFALAEGSGLRVEKVWEWGEVGVWAFA